MTQDDEYRAKYAQENPAFDGKLDTWQAVAGKYRRENEELRAILAASGGAHAVPEGAKFSGKMVEIGTLEDGCGNGFVIEREHGFITVFGLSEAECRAMAKYWGEEITLAAAPTTQDTTKG